MLRQVPGGAGGPVRAPRGGLLAGLLAVLVVSAVPVRSQQLPVQRYGVADGLPSALVNAILQDEKGYLWIATGAGLCRFDGQRFVTFGTREGLPHPFVNALAQDLAGGIWAGTNGGGVARLGLEDPPRLSAFPVDARPGADRVNSLAFDTRGRLWCATDAGLYRGDPDATGSVRFSAVVPHRETAAIMPTLRDHDGSLWFGLLHEVVHVEGGKVHRHAAPAGPGHDEITSLSRDAAGRFLVGFGTSLAALEPGGFVPVPLPFEVPPGQKLYQVLAAPDGNSWIATRRGLVKWGPSGATTYGSQNGLGTDALFSLARDREENLWIGTQNTGLVCLSGDAVSRWTRQEGLPEDLVAQVVLAPDGVVVASLLNAGLARLEAGRAVPLPGSGTAPFHHVAARLGRDGSGTWWLGTDDGLYRAEGREPRLATARRVRAEGGDDIRLTEVRFADGSRGALWAGGRDGTLWRILPGAARPEPVLRIPPTRPGDVPGPLLETRSGVLWATTAAPSLGRVESGRFVGIPPGPGLPEATVRSLFQDSRGRVWIGFRFGGLSMTEEPESARPRFRHWGTGDGLAHETVLSLVEDSRGRIWVGTERGVDRLDPANGTIHHLTAADGLPETRVSALVREPSGSVWAATYGGLVRWDPMAVDRASVPPPVYLRRVAVADEPGARLADGSASSLTLTLPPLPSLSIEWTGIRLSGAGHLGYRYVLMGADRRWSPPTSERLVSYVRLPAGRYRFLVRAVSPDGVESPRPATLSLVVPPPLWRRPSVLAAAGLVLALSALAFHRARVGRLLELERIRTRIAADLHDDVGASLSRIAVLSEAARRTSRPLDADVNAHLERIAGISREVLDSMGDIVWAVNPARDHLADLAQRMRRFAEDVLESAGLALAIDLPDPADDVPLSADVRRETLLIFKESVHNVLRHAGASGVEVKMSLKDRRLLLSVRDDGRGFDPAASYEGHGLVSMRRRAVRLGGRLEVTSAPGKGTRARLDVPLRPPARPGKTRATGSTPGDGGADRH